MPREGQVVDIGLNGVAIMTSTPPPVGAQVDLEIQPKSDLPASSAIFVRGEVVRVARAGERDYLMAVHLRVAPPDAAHYQPHGVDIGELIEVTRRHLHDSGRTAEPVALAEYYLQEARDDSAEERPRKRRRVWLLPLIAFALLASWWYYWGGGGERGGTKRTTTDAADEHARGGFAPPSIQVSELVARAMPAIPDEPSSGAEDASPLSQPLDLVGGAEVSLEPDHAESSPSLFWGGALADAGDWAGAQSAYEDVIASASAPAVERVQGYVGLALALWNQGHADEAGDALREADALEDALPEEWNDAVRALSAAMAADAESVAQHAPRNVADLEPAVSEPVQEGLHLVIDKSNFVLRVVKNGEELRRFPVGLGFAGSTPEGEFVIANMLVDPTWFNRGEAVPPGDARNPLGSRWLGLGRDGTSTSYGIHGTTEPESIGRETSRGCIRMRSRDAEALFVLCSVGTPVTIVP